MSDRLSSILTNFTDSGKLIMQMILEEVKINSDHIHIVDSLQIDRENKLNFLFNGRESFSKITYSFRLSPNDIEDIKANSGL